MDPILEQYIATAKGSLNALADYGRRLADKVTTSAPTPVPQPVPSPSGVLGGSNLPILSDQPFNSFPSAGWTRDSGGIAGQPEVVDDSSAPISAPKVLRFTYPNGMAGGEAPATVVCGLAGRRKLYAGMVFKHSANWQGHNSNVNKLAFFFFEGEGGSFSLVAYGPPAGPFELKAELYFKNGGETRRWLAGNVSGPAWLTMGAWHRVECYLDMPTGILQVAVGERLLLDYRDVRFPAEAPEAFKLSPTWGGAGDTKRQTDVLLYDHVQLKG